MRKRTKLGAFVLAAALCCGSRLSAKSEVTVSDTLSWIEKHRADFRAEWHTSEGPVKWQPEDFKNFDGSRNMFWDRTIKWTYKSDCPRFPKALETDGVTYAISRAVALVGDVTDISEQETTRDATYTKQVWADYEWRLKISQVSPNPIIIDYKEYLKRTNQVDNQTVDAGGYYFVCILPKTGADPDAIVEILHDEKVDDGRGSVSTAKGYRDSVSIAGIATVHDRKMAERLANALGHLIGMMQSQKVSNEPF